VLKQGGMADPRDAAREKRNHPQGGSRRGRKKRRKRRGGKTTKKKKPDLSLARGGTGIATSPTGLLVAVLRGGGKIGNHRGTQVNILKEGVNYGRDLRENPQRAVSGGESAPQKWLSHRRGIRKERTTPFW